MCSLVCVAVAVVQLECLSNRGTQWVLFGFGINPDFFEKAHLDGFLGFHGSQVIKYYYILSTYKYRKMLQFCLFKIL